MTMPVAQPRIALPPRYRVVGHVANGGMASVWAAEDEKLGRLVAVKVLAEGYAADPSARRRFMREARAAARVSDHPHVVTIYDIGEDEHDGRAFIVMEHFVGGTLADRLRGGRPLPVPAAVQWLEEAAAALDAAHAAGVVHRDVKPANFLLDADGRLAVADFGIASLAGETALTQAGQVLGTAAYLSPEQARGEVATPASDRYSLAVVAYELLCGHRPFGGDTPAAQARAHLEDTAPPPDGACAAAAGVLAHGLQKDPAARPQSASEFVAALRRSVGDLAEPDRVTEPRFTRTQVTTPLQAKRSRPVAPFAALIAVLLAAALVFAVVRADDEERPPAKPERSTSRAKQPEPRTPPRRQAAAAPADPVALNDAGFARLRAGDATGAVEPLQRAIDAFRAQGRTSELPYAYALFNLGAALNALGRHDEAIPFLEERMRFNNQKGRVKQELKRALRGDDD